MKAKRNILLVSIAIISFGFIFSGGITPKIHQSNCIKPGNFGVFPEEPAKIQPIDPAKQNPTYGALLNETGGHPSFTEYLSQNMATAIIGSTDGLDNPSDNIFVIDVNDRLNSSKNVYLEYELFGVEDFTNITHSINDNLAMGGSVVRKSNKWAKQREQINPDFLKPGKNVIRFSAFLDKMYQYEVRNVSVKVETNLLSADRRLVVNQPTTSYYFKTFGYVQGFLEGEGSKDAVVTINQKRSLLINSVFEEMVTKPDFSEDTWTAVVEAKFSDGQVLRSVVKFDKPVVWDIYNGFDKTLCQVELPVNANESFELKLQGAYIQADSCSLDECKTISITALRDIDFPPLEPGMINVTGGHAGYRFLPHGTMFNDDVCLGIPYDECKIPVGYSPMDITTFYFDETKRHWIALPKEGVDMQCQAIISHTNHFTEFINTIIKVPESPQTQAYLPTSMKDIKAANPLEGLRVIEPPKANNMGTANIGYPLNIPQGRKGMQPNLALTYNSSGGNGWLGLGWDISIPSISVETQWGVPHYDPNFESETYLYGGNQLCTHGIDNKLKPPVFRRKWENRLTSSTTEFYPRVEGEFNKTIRHGTSPTNYWWEVIDKTGTTTYYGKSFTTDAVDFNKVLRDDNGNIAYWALSEIKDVYGNWIRYYYDIVEDAGVSGSQINGRQIYISKIVYTGHGSEEGRYSISFNRGIKTQLTKRKDITISGRYGFKEVTADLLVSIYLKFDDPINGITDLRRYYFGYNNNNPFKKSYLCGFAESDPTGSEFLNDIKEEGLTIDGCSKFDRNVSEMVKIHYLEYFNDLTSTSDIIGYPQMVTLETDDDNLDGNLLYPIPESALGATQEKNWGIGGALTVGFDFTQDLKSKNMTIGGNYHYSVSKSDGISTLIDIDGDGLPDRVFNLNTPDMLFYRSQLLSPIGGKDFSAIKPLSGRGAFLHEESKTNSWGAEMIFGFNQNTSVSASCGWSNAKSRTSTYFADVNADGFPDIVDNGVAYFNKVEGEDGRAFRAAEGEFVMVGSNPCNNITYVGTINSAVMDNPRQGESEDRKLFDAVRVWAAPYSGYVDITSTINLIKDFSDARTYSASADGVRYRIQYKNTPLDLFKDSIDGNFYDPITNILPPLYVTAGDRIYFRLQSRKNNDFDRVNWTPVIKYVGQSDIDAEGKNIYTFNAAEDFLLCGSQEYFAPVAGNIYFDGLLHIPITSDDVTLRIVKNGTSNIVNTTYSGLVENNVNVSSTISVNEGDKIEFFLEASTNIRWNDITYKPHLYFVSTTDPLYPAINVDGTYNFEYYPIVHYSVFPISKFPSKTNNFSAYTGMQITPSFTHGTTTASGDIIFAVKTSNAIIAKQITHIINGNFGTPAQLPPFDIPAEAIYFEYYVTNDQLASVISSPKAHVVCNNPSLNAYYDAGLHTAAGELAKFGCMYRGWGQFIYNNLQDLDYKLVIDELSLSLPTTPPTPPSSNVSLDTSYNGILNAVPAQFNPLQKFITMSPNPKESLFSGFGDRNSIDRYTQNNVQLIYEDVSFDDSLVVQLPNSPNVLAVRKLNRSTSTSFGVNGTYTTTGLSMTGSIGESYLTLDYMDLNGDRYPDIVGEKNAQYSNSCGGMSDLVIDHSLNLVPSNKGTSYSGGSSFGTSYVGIRKIAGRDPKTTKSSLHADANIAANVGAGSSQTAYSWVDMNGDGLPDKVTKDGLVALNVGYRFLPFEDWGDVVIRNSGSFNFGLSAGGSLSYMKFSKWNMSVAGGIGQSKSSNDVKELLQDINGDGLPDRVKVTSSGFEYCLNTGAGFDQVNSSPTSYKIGESKTTSESYNAAITFGIKFGYLPIKLCINPQASGGKSYSVENLQLVDMNGDSYPDFVSSDSPNDFHVSYSNIGRTNLLKSVKDYLGGQICLNYELSTCSEQSPQRTWLMSSVLVYDGFPEDGPDQLFSYSYSHPYYDRFERQSYGFGSVMTTQINQGSPLIGNRILIENFENNNYLFKGIKNREIVLDGDLNVYTNFEYRYVLKDIPSGDSIPNPECFGEGYPAISKETKRYHEGQLNIPPIITQKEYFHGPFGNIKDYFDNGDINTTNDDLQTHVEYSPYNGINYIVSAPILVTVKQNIDNYRKREADIDATTGAIKEMRLFDELISSPYNMKYDSFGNMSSILYPENETNQRVNYFYIYDPVLNTYVIQVKDHFGYSSYSSYYYDWGNIATSTDITGQSTIYEYDKRGRVKKLTGPNEIAAAKPYTIRFDHWDLHGRRTSTQDSVCWARTYHYDPSNPTNAIATVIFTDAQGKVLQTKKDSYVYDGTTSSTEQFIVSGRVAFDGFGRTISSHYPITESLGIQSDIYFNPDTDSQNPTETSYDIQDRVTSVLLPDGSSSANVYTLGVHPQNGISFLNINIDAKSVPTETYMDAAGKRTTIVSPGGLITSFEYDPMGQLIKSTDPEQFSTHYEYDKLGRMTLRNHPDAGVTTTYYDKAGSITKIQTQNLLNPSRFITYAYNFNHLIHIFYPDNPANTTSYEYAAPNSGNNTGRVITQIDASGVQKFNYGRLGEVIENSHTFIEPYGTFYTFKTKTTYDTWNRINEVVYPDGETLRYNYNVGGLLSQMTGMKAGQPYDYITDVKYDKFESKYSMTYGNGTTNIYHYDAQMRRLDRLTALTSNNDAMMDNAYTYDLVSNISGITNYAQGFAGIGGPATYSFYYNDNYQLVNAYGSYQSPVTDAFSLHMEYSASGSINQKAQVHTKNQNTVFATTYNFQNTYAGLPHAPSGNSLGDVFQYDGNGNLTYSYDGTTQRHKNLAWDEANRLKIVAGEDRISYYLYQGSTDRHLKIEAQLSQMTMNGNSYLGGFQSDRQTLYVNPFMVCSVSGYTKHYYADNQRIASKIGGGFSTIDCPENAPYNYGLYANSVFWYFSREYQEEQMIANDLLDLQLNLMLNLTHTLLEDPATNGTLGTQAIENQQYFYHSDHLGSSSYISDNNGDPTQHLEYFPFGETFVDERLGTYNTPYKFTGKELDEETGLMYYGARYYDPRTSVFLGVDALSDDQPDVSPYTYCLNNPITKTDPDGNGWEDIIKGAIYGVVDNMAGTNLRSSYTPDNPSDYNSSLNKADAASMVFGIALTIGGADATAGGVVAAPVTGGASLAVAATGAAVAVEGTFMAANAVKNQTKGNHYGENQQSKNKANVTKTYSTRKEAKDARPKPNSAKPGQKQETRQTRNKTGEGNKMKTDGGKQSPHFHDKNHNNKNKQNVHYRTADN